jgi:hypothetical protein
MSRYKTRVPLESGPCLSFRGVKLQPDTSSRIRWQVGSLTITFRDQTQILDLVSQPRHLGGVQWYFVCPKTGRNVSTLWKPPGSPAFASRHAWPRQVAYSSQYADPCGLAWKAQRKVVDKLGATDPNDYDLPSKPKWMRWRTYDALTARYEAAEDRLNMGLMNAAPALGWPG